MATTKLPDTMRSAQWTLYPIESSLTINAHTPLPKNANALPKNSTLVKIAYASVNPVDYKMAEFTVARYLAMGRGPWIPCCDFSGTVVATTCSHVKAGDRVVGWTAIPKFNTLAEYAVVEGAENVGKIPDNADLKVAATLGVAGQTAMQSIAPFVKPGSKVLINGASGGTGTFGIQIAKILKCSVTAICSGANAQLCKDLGADTVIDYRSVDAVHQLQKENVQYDLIVDNVGIGGDVYANSQSYLKESGKYVTIAAGPNLASLLGMLKTFLLPRWLGGTPRNSVLIACTPNSAELSQLAEWVQDGSLKPYIENVYSLENSASAFSRIKSGRTRGKLVIEVSSSST